MISRPDFQTVTPDAQRPPKTYRAFWPLYLAEHRRPGNRHLHFLGTALALLLIASAAVLWDWRPLAAAPLAGYGLAWLGHAAVERNRPATFSHPLWSLGGDMHMFSLWLIGRLGAELRRHGID